jgi:type I restriction enzyme R subunit
LAVRWQIAIEKYIKQKNYPMKSLVAFSGEVNDKELGPEPFKETSKELNPGLKGRNIRDG